MIVSTFLFVVAPGYALEQNYPLEVKLGRDFVNGISKKLGIQLPKGEVQGIAMHFINARNGMIDSTATMQGQLQQRYDELLEQATCIIEQELNISVRRDSFNFARFATHMEWYNFGIF